MHKYFKSIIIIVIIAIIVTLIIASNLYNIFLKKLYPKKYSNYVEQYSAMYNVDPLLVYSIIKVESNFDENAESSSGAKGLMQLMDTTAIEISNKIDNSVILQNENITEPEKNIMIGIYYYSYLYDKYDKNMLLALTAYNAGIGNVEEWISEGVIKRDGSDIENVPFKETNMYVRKIINNYKMYQKLYSN